MRLKVLTDGSAIIDRSDATLHVDIHEMALHVRTPSASRALGGILLASYPLETVQGVQVAYADEAWQAWIVLRRGAVVSLGRSGARQDALAVAQAVATRATVAVDIDPPLLETAPSAQEVAVPAIAPDFAMLARPVFTGPINLIHRGPKPTRYFRGAPGCFVHVPSWSGARVADGAFVRAMRSSIPILPYAQWPAFGVQPDPAPRGVPGRSGGPSRYFVGAPGLLVGRHSHFEASMSRPVERDEPVAPVDDVDRGLPFEQLREVVGPWREPTPPPRFPPSTRPSAPGAPPSTDGAIPRAASPADELETVEMMRRPPVTAAFFDAPTPSQEAPEEADWAVSFYRTLASEPPAAPEEPALPRARALDDEDDEEPATVLPPPRRRPESKASVVPSRPPPAILEIPGFNDRGAKPPASGGRLDPPLPAFPSSGPPSFTDEPVFLRLLTESYRAAAPARPPALRPPATLLELLRRYAEDMPIAEPEVPTDAE